MPDDVLAAAESAGDAAVIATKNAVMKGLRIKAGADARRLHSIQVGGFKLGRMMGIRAVGRSRDDDRWRQAMVIRRVATFNDFNADNDPHGEHDFGAIELCGRRFFFKIDYFDAAIEFGAEDPADPTKTTRVLTIMVAEEY